MTVATADPTVELYRCYPDQTEVEFLIEIGIPLTKEARIYCAATTYPRLTVTETIVWDEYLPECLCNCPDCNQLTDEKLEQFPLEVREAIAFARQSNLFDFVEIWLAADDTDAPEAMCFGIIGNCDDDTRARATYPIARWGYNLLTYGEIADEIIVGLAEMIDELVEDQEAAAQDNEATCANEAEATAKFSSNPWPAFIVAFILLAAFDILAHFNVV